METVIKLSVKIALTVLGVYAAVSFVQGDVNLIHWSMETRGVAAIISGGFIAMVMVWNLFDEST